MAMMTHNLAVSVEGIRLMVPAGIAPSIVASYLWMQELKHIGNERVAVSMSLISAFTAVMAVVTLGETVCSYHWIGSGLVLLDASLA